jgi:hypothetical protein
LDFVLNKTLQGGSGICPVTYSTGIRGEGGLSSRVNQQEREADHSSASSSEVKNAWSYHVSYLFAFIACKEKILPYILL